MRDPQLGESYWPADTQLALDRTTLGDLLRRAAGTVPDRVALVDAVADPAQRRRWTYRELLGEAEAAARALLGSFDPGDRVAIWSPNCAEWAVLQYGAALAGLVLVTVNPSLRDREIAHVLGQSRAAGLVYAPVQRGEDSTAILARVRDELPSLRWTLCFDQWDTFLRSADPNIPLPVVEPTDAIQIQYTSGTTGFPKGCQLHHLGTVNAALFAATRSGLKSGAVWINPMPMFHVGSCVMGAVGIAALFGTHVLLPAFQPDTVLDIIESERGSMMLVVPTMLHALVNHPGIEQRDLSSMQSMLIGGSGCPAPLVRQAEHLFGCTVAIGFGQTEAHGVVMQTELTDSWDERMTTVGHALPHMESAILDPASGALVKHGDLGEICVRGYQTMLGYFDMPQATESTIDRDGWLHTGDLGTMDDAGFVRVTGRLKDMIIRGGENIYPREIEDCLAGHPAVSAAEVVGIPDERWGEQVAAVVRLVASHEGPHQDVAQELHAFCRANMASFKVPRTWFIVAELPITASGKIQKFVLRQQIIDGDLEPAWAVGADPTGPDPTGPDTTVGAPGFPTNNPKRNVIAGARTTGSTAD